MEARKAELQREAAPKAVAAVTLGAYADTWLVTVRSSIEPRTLQSYQGMIKNHIRPAFGTRTLASITRGHIKELLAAKRESGLSKNTVRSIRATLSVMFTDAIDAELVTSNPTARTGQALGRRTPDKMTATERRQQIKPMSIEQLAAFLRESAKTSRHYNMFLLLADTGLRPGEARGLQWPDVDLVARTVHVERAVERGGRIKGTKTGASRTVDLTPRLAAALDRLQTSVEAEALAAGREAPALVFPSGRGTFDITTIAKAYGAVVLRAGLPKFRLYDLRHTFATHLLQANAPITYVADQLGHAKPTTTLQHYAHWIPRGDRALADRLEALRTGGADAAHGPQMVRKDSGASTIRS
jgi:integrase